MEYPVYYELNFDSFKKFTEFMGPATNEIAGKAALSPQEMAVMKEAIAQAVAEHNERVGYSAYYQVSLTNFGIQYAAYYNEKGEKMIWLNGFTKDSSFYRAEGAAYFESDVVFVLDGGNNYFDMLVNLATGAAAGIRIHGSA